MNVLIFGATGGTGLELVKQAETLGHIRALYPIETTCSALISRPLKIFVSDIPALALLAPVISAAGRRFSLRSIIFNLLGDL